MAEENLGIKALKDFCRELKNHSRALQIILNRISQNEESSPEIFMCLSALVLQKNQTKSITTAMERLIEYYESEEK